MKELQIDPELRDLLPPLTTEEYTQLEKNIVDNGFNSNFPIITWNGFIVDGHNRYKICQEHGIEFTDRYISYDSKTELMEWMINTQMGRRNLSPAQRLSIVEKFKKRIQAEAKAKRKNTEGRPTKLNCTPNGEQIQDTPKIHTDKQIAKMAGVSTGTVARYNQVMKSDKDDIKKKVLTGDLTINAGYAAVREKKEQSDEELASKIISDIKIPKKAIDYLDISVEIDGVRMVCDKYITDLEDKIFNPIYHLLEKFSAAERTQVINYITEANIKTKNIIKIIRKGVSPNEH